MSFFLFHKVSIWISGPTISVLFLDWLCYLYFFLSLVHFYWYWINLPKTLLWSFYIVVQKSLMITYYKMLRCVFFRLSTRLLNNLVLIKGPCSLLLPERTDTFPTSCLAVGCSAAGERWGRSSLPGYSYYACCW